MSEKEEKMTGAEDPGELLHATVNALRPLYVDDHTDRPDGVLSAFPDTIHVAQALKLLVDVMFPGRMTPGSIRADELGIFLDSRLSQAWNLLFPEIEKAIPFRWTGQAARMEGPPEPTDAHREARRVMGEFYRRLPAVRDLLVDDVKAAYDGDPAALSYAVIQLAYPGMLAVTSHRLAHELYHLQVPIVPRVMSEWTHSRTGVDINPGATIGRGFFIDHATGVVIGETTRIGDNVKIYQGVTLGAKSFSLDDDGHPVKHVKRHPSVGDNVIIYANSTILGNIEIGSGTTIGGNVFLTESVPQNSFVASKHAELRIKTSE